MSTLFLSFHSIFYHIPFPTSFTNLCLLECLIVLADPKQSRSTAAEHTIQISVYLLLTRPPMHTDDIKTSTWVGFSGPGDIDSLAPAQTIRETRMIYLKRANEKGEISRKCSGPFPKAYPGVTAQPPSPLSPCKSFPHKSCSLTPIVHQHYHHLHCCHH